MTYYEELGISANATVEEIRQAYKRLARLLHPDKLQNEKQRHVAECQMKRLNGVYETLVNVESRMAYDESLRAVPLVAQPAEEEIAPAPEKPTWMDFVRWLQGPAGAWTGAGALGLLLLLWALPDTVRFPEESGKPGPRREEAVTETAARREEMRLPDPQLPQLRQRLAEMRRERDEALMRVQVLSEELGELQKRAPPVEPAAAVESVPAPAFAAVPQVEPSTPRPAAPPVEARGMAGHWYFAKSAAPSGRDLYPPEYIEAVIQEESGILRGRYRARYRVPDRAISPEVAFEFSGKGGGDAARLPWLGEGGARGEVRIHLLTGNTLEVAWVAGELGKIQGLGSGRAILVRRADP
ncbi:MAG: DnaJ domain-containing protein [Bryobacterales bacterium]|nr:DnaJ domain-containing protein [Bryobacterales bacterium]